MRNSKETMCDIECVCFWRREWGRKGERNMHICLWMQGCLCVYTCVGVCMLMPLFALAGVRSWTRERIWQACLLSPQNNCLWITWGKSQYRHLEMTHPGDSLNRVNIRSERGFDFVFVFLRMCVCILPRMRVMFVCGRLQIQGDMLSLIFLTHTEVISLCQSCLLYKHIDFVYTYHQKTHTPFKAIICDSAHFYLATADKPTKGTIWGKFRWHLGVNIFFFLCVLKKRRKQKPVFQLFWTYLKPTVGKSSQTLTLSKLNQS